MLNSFYTFFDMEHPGLKIRHCDLEKLGCPNYLYLWYKDERIYIIPVPDDNKEIANLTIPEGYYSDTKDIWENEPDSRWGPFIVLHASYRKLMERIHYYNKLERILYVPCDVIPFVLNGTRTIAMEYRLDDSFEDDSHSKDLDYTDDKLTFDDIPDDMKFLFFMMSKCEGWFTNYYLDSLKHELELIYPDYGSYEPTEERDKVRKCFSEKPDVVTYFKWMMSELSDEIEKVKSELANHRLSTDDDSEKRRTALWAVNAVKEPVPLAWEELGYSVFDNDDDMVPICPVCREMPYSFDQCTFCGQRFIHSRHLDIDTHPHITVTKGGLSSSDSDSDSGQDDWCEDDEAKQFVSKLIED